MNPRFVRLRPEFTVDEAIRYVRIQGRDLAQPIGDAYVLDLEQRLLGIVSPLERFSWPVDRTIDGLMRTDRIRYRNWREFAGAYFPLQPWGSDSSSSKCTAIGSPEW